MRAGGPEGDRDAVLGDFQLEVSWDLGVRWGAEVQVGARAEPGSIDSDRDGGLVTAFLRFNQAFRERDQLRLRAGLFFPPTSRENLEPGWSSPYTLTFSTINSWIGEEVRPTGLEAEYSLALARDDTLQVGGAVFLGNDTAGTLLAWRGWAFGDRLTFYGETLPLPPISSLQDGGGFGAQQDSGTQPFGSDLDGRPGWYAYARWQRPERALVQLTHFDNRGDRALHGGEYAWATRYDQASLELTPGDWTFAAEVMFGETEMGTSPFAKVRMDFEAAYALASWGREAYRFSLRYDTFDNEDLDRTALGDNNEDYGDAWTLAFLWHPGPRLRLGLEALHQESRRPEAAALGLPLETDGDSLLFELRYRFSF